MNIPMPETLSSYWPLATLIGALSAVGAVLKFVRGAWDFHYDYFTRRHLKRMIELLPLTEVGSEQQKFLRKVIDAEIFKIASDVKASARQADFLMCLCEHGLVAPNQIKRIAPFVRLDGEGRVAIKISWLDKAFVIYAAICSAAVFVYGLGAFAVLVYLGATRNTLMPILIGSVLFLGCAFVVRYFLNDVRRYRAAKRIQEKVKSGRFPPRDKNKMN